MHTGSRAFCFLMALAATGTEVTSLAAVPSTSAGHYCVEAKLATSPDATAVDSVSLPSVVVANHVLAVVAVSRVLALPSGDSGETSILLKVRPVPDGSFVISFVRTEIVPAQANSTPTLQVQHLDASIAQSSAAFRAFSLPACSRPRWTYTADGRLLASLADANRRQLLFVKITRG